MPDSQLPPSWGPASEERDLDAVLSGETYAIPEALRPVAGTLAALRAAAAPAELSGEDAARAAFRAAFQAAAAGGTGTENAEPGTVPGHTLILTPEGRSRHRVARHRRHRRPRSPGGSRRPGLLITSAAALAVAALAITLTAFIPGQIDRLASSGKSAGGGGVAARGTGSTPRSQTVYGNGNREPTFRPTPASTPAPVPVQTESASAAAPPSGSTLCRDWEDLPPPQSRTAKKAAQALWKKLRKLARGHGSVLSYCKPYLDQFRGRGPRPTSYPTYPSYPSPGAVPSGISQRGARVPGAGVQPRATTGP